MPITLPFNKTNYLGETMILSQSCCFLTIYIFFCFFLLPNTFASPTRSLCRNDQRDALFELQEELQIPTISWNKTLDCCSWSGVTCDAISGEVTSLQLYSICGSRSRSLDPTSSLFKLHHLRELDLSACGLYGEIPSSIGNLSHLTSLELFNNDLEGELPASLGNLNQLSYLGLTVNNLGGHIPTSFSNLTKLSELKLMKNQFTGGETVLANLTSLSHIDLSLNHFKSLISPDLSNFHKLEKFIGNDNKFVGPFPSSLLMIPSLVEINLGQNQFEGPIDSWNISSSSSLQVLVVSNNKLDGFILETISKLVNLNRLDLSHNRFKGVIPESISTLVNLQSLDLSYNNLGGRVPRSIAKLVNLNLFDLSNNKLEGQVPHYLWRLPKLYSVKLSHNSLSSFEKSAEVMEGESLSLLDLGSNLLQGSLPQWICKFGSLGYLDFSNNNFTGLIPQCFTYLEKLSLRNNSLSGVLSIDGSKLRVLDVSRNNLVGKLPRSLINCTKLEFLNVGRNKINDTFPFWLGSLQKLAVLLLPSNAFFGPVYNPSAYIGFPGLQIIDISNNNFVGSLPQDYFANWTGTSLPDIPEYNYVVGGNTKPHMENLGHIPDLFDPMDLVYKGVDTKSAQFDHTFRAIDFSGNRFSGLIPESIGLLTDLRHLNLSGNSFMGSIPLSLTNIRVLEVLDLSRNNLSGKIPQGLGQLTTLSKINVSHNNLEGLVPQSTQFGTQDCSAFTGNLKLDGFEKDCEVGHQVPVPTSQPPEEVLSESEEEVLNWKAAAIAAGPGVFCGLVIGHIFTFYKHEWFVKSR